MPTVLIIDDDSRTRDTYRVALSASSFDVVTADAGRRGVSIALCLKPDVVVADLRLPDISGVDIIRQLRGFGYYAPAIVITGFATTRSGSRQTPCTTSVRRWVIR